MKNTETKQCKKCKESIDKNAKVCSHCGAKQGLPKWLIIVIAIIVIGVIASMSDGESAENNKQKNKVTVTNFTDMTSADIDSWCDTNKVKCSVKEEYSDTIAKGKLVSQSVEADKTVYEGDKITITISLGKKPTTEQKNALKKAESYSKTLHMSKKGIYNQLTSSVEGFSKADAQYAIDNIEADWNQNALEKAKSYQNTMNMSKKAIYNQLTSSIEGFTKKEAQYAIDHLDD